MSLLYCPRLSIIRMRNAYRSRQHKPVIIPKSCLREPSRNETKAYGNDRQRPSSYDTTFDKRIFVGEITRFPIVIRHLERMQQIVINHSLQSQLTRARYSRLRTGKVGGKTNSLVSVATCKAMQLRQRHALHPPADRGVHMYSPLTVSGKWHSLHNLRTIGYTSNFVLVSAFIRNVKDQVTYQIPAAHQESSSLTINRLSSSTAPITYDRKQETMRLLTVLKSEYSTCVTSGCGTSA